MRILLTALLAVAFVSSSCLVISLAMDHSSDYSAIGELLLVAVISLEGIVAVSHLWQSRLDGIHETLVSSIESYSNVLTTLAQNQQLAGLYSRGLSSPETLDVAEEVQFSCFVGQLFWSWEMIFHQSDGRRLAPAIWDAHVSIIDDVLTTPGAKLWWRNRRRWYTDQFRDFIDGRIREPKGIALHGWSSRDRALRRAGDESSGAEAE